MSLKDKYHIDNQVWIDMIRNGVISCSVAKQEEILATLKRKKDSGTAHSEAVKQTAMEIGCSEQWVYEVIRRYQ